MDATETLPIECTVGHIHRVGKITLFDAAIDVGGVTFEIYGLSATQERGGLVIRPPARPGPGCAGKAMHLPHELLVAIGDAYAELVGRPESVRHAVSQGW